MNWYKYRENASSSKGQWQYVYTDTEDTVREIAESSCESISWSEHYRGLNIEKITQPPDEWIQEEVIKTTEFIVNKQLYVAYLKTLL